MTTQSCATKVSGFEKKYVQEERIMKKIVGIGLLIVAAYFVITALAPTVGTIM